MRVAVYRVLIGSYDYVISDLFLDKNFDFYLFTDNPKLTLKKHKIIEIDREANASLQNRRLKILIPEILHSYDVVIYIDMNIKICSSINNIVRKFFLTNLDIAFCMHPYGHDLFEEVDSCIRNKQAKKERLNAELNYYEKSNLKARLPLSDNSFIIRRISNYKNKQYGEEWFSNVKKFSGRDQISFPYIRYKYDLKEMILQFSPRNHNNEYFSVIPHKFSSIKNRKITFLKYLISFCIRYSLMYLKFIRFLTLNFFNKDFSHSK